VFASANRAYLLSLALQETYLTEIDDDVRSRMYGELVLAIEIAIEIAGVFCKKLAPQFHTGWVFECRDVGCRYEQPESTFDSSS